VPINLLSESAPVDRQEVGAWTLLGVAMQDTMPSVLIVDDEPSICALIREELAEGGFSCFTATEPEQAQGLLGSQHFDLLITDIAMPRISGLDLLAYVNRQAPGCRVILITGVSTRAYVAQAIMLGAYDYIEKPLSMDGLLDIALRATKEEAENSRLPQRAAVAMELSSQAKQAALDSVRALAVAIEARDPYTRQHSEQVTHYAVHLAKAMSLPDETVERIRVAALLHDIGKIGVPDSILTKIGPLTAEEFRYIQRHPVIGAEILTNITMFGEEATLVRYHHENWNGDGYPEGLAGEAAPVGSRIIRVADSMDAMLMDRTYKRRYPVERVLLELERCAGKQFDPKIAIAAVQWCRTNLDKLILPRGGADT